MGLSGVGGLSLIMRLEAPPPQPQPMKTRAKNTIIRREILERDFVAIGFFSSRRNQARLDESIESVRERLFDWHAALFPTGRSVAAIDGGRAFWYLLLSIIIDLGMILTKRGRPRPLSDVQGWSPLTRIGRLLPRQAFRCTLSLDIDALGVVDARSQL